MGAISRLYLTVYNSACLATWSYISYKIAAHYANDGKPETLWPEVEQPLKAVQTAAILEVAHAATGLVRSGVATTFIQGKCRNTPKTRWNASHLNSRCRTRLPRLQC